MPLRLRDFVVENTAGAIAKEGRTNEEVRGGGYDGATSVKTGSGRSRGGRDRGERDRGGRGRGGRGRGGSNEADASVAVRPTTLQTGSGRGHGGRGSGRRGCRGRSRGGLGRPVVSETAGLQDFLYSCVVDVCVNAIMNAITRMRVCMFIMHSTFYVGVANFRKKSLRGCS